MKKRLTWADLRLLLAYLLVTLPCMSAGYAYEAGWRAFRAGRRRFGKDLEDEP